MYVSILVNTHSFIHLPNIDECKLDKTTHNPLYKKNVKHRENEETKKKTTAHYTTIDTKKSKRTKQQKILRQIIIIINEKKNSKY